MSHHPLLASGHVILIDVMPISSYEKVRRHPFQPTDLSIYQAIEEYLLKDQEMIYDSFKAIDEDAIPARPFFKWLMNTHVAFL